MIVALPGLFSYLFFRRPPNGPNKYIYFTFLHNSVSLGNRVAIILGKSCQLCWPAVHFEAA